MTAPQTEITARDVTELADPIGGVIAEEVARRWYEIATANPAQLQVKIAEQEELLRSPGGIAWATFVLSGKLMQRLANSVHPLLRQCLPLPAAAVAVERLEALCRDAYASFLEGFVKMQLCRDTEYGEDRLHHLAAEAVALKDAVRERAMAAVAAAG